MKRVIIVLVVLAAVGAAAGAYYMRQGTAEITVNTAPVTRGDIIDSVGSTGTLQAVTTVQVGSQVSGQIAWLGADFNSIVTQGQTIARLDPSLIAAQLEASKANLTQARANLTRAQSDLERLAVQLQDAQQKHARAKELNARELLPQSELDAAKVAVDIAQASLKSQQATITQVAASITQAEASVNQTQVNLDHTIITAPIDGIVIQRSVDVGQTVAASMNAPTLFIIAADLTKMQVSANIDEADVGRIRPGQHVTFRVDAYPTEQFEGTVTQIRLQPVVQSNVTTYGTIINVPNPDLKLKPGMTANLRVEVTRRNNVLRVPNAASRFRPTADIFAALNQPVPPEAQQLAGRGQGRGQGTRGQGGQGAPASRAGGTAASLDATAAAGSARGAAPPTPARQGSAPGGTEPGRGSLGGEGGGRRGDGAAFNRSQRGNLAGGSEPGEGGGFGGASRGEGGNYPGGRGQEQSGGFGGRGQRGIEGREGGGFGGRGQAGGAGRGQGGVGGRAGGGGPERMLERFRDMTPDQQQQFLARMRERGQDTSALEAATAGRRGATTRATSPAATQDSEAPAAAQTIDALFAPLQPVEIGPGRVWLYVDKQLKPVSLRLGITDGTNTELLSGDLQEGAEVVTGVVGAGQTRPQPGVQGTGNPFQQRGGPPGGFGGPPPGGGFGGGGGGGGGGRGR